MKTFIALKASWFCLAAMLFLFACAPKTTQVVSGWQVWASGIESEQRRVAAMTLDKKTKLEYETANDEKNLYLFFQTDDPVTRMKILRTGLTVKITAPGSTQGPAILKYPVPEERITLFDWVGRTPSSAERPSGRQGTRRGGQNPPDAGVTFQRALAEQKAMSLNGFLNHPNGMVALEQGEGIQLNVGMDPNGMMFYQITIPLFALVETQQTPEMTESEFIVEVSLYGMERPAGPIVSFGGPGMGGARRGGGMRPGDPMSGMPYEGRPAGPQSGSSEFSRMTKDEGFRFAFRLASKP